MEHVFAAKCNYHESENLVLIINSRYTEDITAPPANFLIMTERIPGAWLVQLREGGHGLIFQYPNEFSEIMETFLSVS